MSSLPNKQNFVFKVKEQCEFRTPLEDKIRVMVRSSALKAPISTRSFPSVQITWNTVLGEITKVLHTSEESHYINPSLLISSALKPDGFWL